MEALYWALAVLVMSGAGFLLGRRQGRVGPPEEVLAVLGPSQPMARSAARAVAETEALGAIEFEVSRGDETIYSGNSGGGARRCIEKLRADGVEWTATRDGEPWDWGPR